jgi:hypothetical protein
MMRSGTSGLTNAADALRLEEVKRTRTLLQIGWIVARTPVFQSSSRPAATSMTYPSR